MNHWTITFCKSASKFDLRIIKLVSVACSFVLVGLGVLSAGLLHDLLITLGLVAIGVFFTLVVVESRAKQEMIWFARKNRDLVKLEAPLDARFEKGHAYFSGIQVGTGEPVLVDLVGDRPFLNIFPQGTR